MTVESPFLAPSRRQDQSWPYWYLVPIYPYGQRQTLRREIVPGTIWLFEQVQGIFYVVVPIRMTVIRLNTGGLLLYAPIAPTKECLGLLRELIDQYGPVKYIILPTISGLEHKVNVGPMARHCPEATVYVAPGQWSFPLKLPLTWLGFPPGRTQVLPADSRQTPFASEFDYAYLGPLDLRLGQFGEMAFFHWPSKSLLVTDTLLSIPENPPPVLEQDPTPLLFHAKDHAGDRPENTPANRAKGWQRICLFTLYFQASTLHVPDCQTVWQAAQQVGDRRPSNYFGLYPFHWQPQWQDTFAKLQGQGQLRVAPILQELILNREPQRVLAWVESLAQWPIERLIACHFSAPVATHPQQIRQAFAFLQNSSTKTDHPFPDSPLLPPEDLHILRRIDQFLVRWRITPPPTVRDKF
ncbi:MAG: DUF4336 domain-containing protein [Synechocystis sp.]|nr:DUF4336 domain-containing protein [Synechocystis sp.]